MSELPIPWARNVLPEFYDPSAGEKEHLRSATGPGALGRGRRRIRPCRLPCCLRLGAPFGGHRAHQVQDQIPPARNPATPTSRSSGDEAPGPPNRLSAPGPGPPAVPAPPRPYQTWDAYNRRPQSPKEVAPPMIDDASVLRTAWRTFPSTSDPKNAFGQAGLGIVSTTTFTRSTNALTPGKDHPPTPATPPSTKLSAEEFPARKVDALGPCPQGMVFEESRHRHAVGRMPPPADRPVSASGLSPVGVLPVDLAQPRPAPDRFLGARPVNRARGRKGAGPHGAPGRGVPGARPRSKGYNVRLRYGKPYPWRMATRNIAVPRAFEKAPELGIT